MSQASPGPDSLWFNSSSGFPQLDLGPSAHRGGKQGSHFWGSFQDFGEEKRKGGDCSQNHRTRDEAAQMDLFQNHCSEPGLAQQRKKTCSELETAPTGDRVSTFHLQKGDSCGSALWCLCWCCLPSQGSRQLRSHSLPHFWDCL